MKKAFTIVEVSILFVIFLIVAFLVAPLSLDDSMQARNTSRWRSVQSDFENIFYSLNTLEEQENLDFAVGFNKVMKNEIRSDSKDYRITFLNGTNPNNKYSFKEFKTTYSNATVAFNLFDDPKDSQKGVLMYDVNGSSGPNIWGKDVFGFNIHDDRFEPFCKNKSLNEQKKDCSRNGTGVCCSNYYLIGGSFD